MVFSFFLVRVMGHTRMLRLDCSPTKTRFWYPSHTFLLKTILNRFLNAKTLLGFKSLLYAKKKKTHSVLFFLVRVMGLEPIRRRHTPLKRACLPIPAHSQIFLPDDKKYYTTRHFNCQYKFLGFFLTVKFQQQKYIILSATMYTFDNLRS